MLRTPCSSPSPPAESMDCNRRAGFYYDKLLKKCINCTTVCGQHPKQCAPSCEGKATRKGRQSGDVGQDPPGLGWKRSWGTKAREGAATHPPPLHPGGLCACVLPFCWDWGRDCLSPVFSIVRLHHTLQFPFCVLVLYRPVLQPYWPGAGSVVAFHRIIES